jgi:class 3 adenylate cyclase
MRSEDSLERSGIGPVEETPREVEVTLLFCDVVRSTELTRRLGDCGAYRVIQSFHDVVLRASVSCHGEELELRGDGVLLAFDSAPPGLDCAIEIQRRLWEAPRIRRVGVRIGLHTGPALRVPSGYFGGNVILSARVAAAAAPGQILASAAHVERLPNADLSATAGRWVRLKGIPEPRLVFSMPWRTNGARRPGPPCSPASCEALLRAFDPPSGPVPGEAETACEPGRQGAA